jgi:osmotically-inducible protein OsmY
MIRTITKAVALAAILVVLVPATLAATPQTTDLTNNFRGAGAAIDQLQVVEISGIVILRGRAADKAQAEAVGLYAQNLGYTRVANLIQIATHDDARIARQVERELSVHRALDGCQFSVSSDQGVVHVAGHVKHELQKDVAAAVLRSIKDVRSVEMTLDRF